MTFLWLCNGRMQHPVPASVIATTLLTLHKINTNLCQEGLLDLSLDPKAFSVTNASALPLATLNSRRCFCVHFPEFEINWAEKGDGHKGKQCQQKNKKEIRPRTAVAGSWEIRHWGKARFSFCVSGSYSRMCLIESALFHNDVWSNGSGNVL